MTPGAGGRDADGADRGGGPSVSTREPSPGPGPAVLAATALVVLLGAACWVEPVDRAELEESESGPGLEERVASALEASADAWNRGDLEGFMSVYLQSPRTTYVGSTGLEVGYEAIRQRYAPLFEPGAARDSLAFESLRIRALGDDVAVGTARWVLRDGDEVTGSGPFTLVLQRTEGGWRIVHDHSSSDPDAGDAAAGGGAGGDDAGAGGDATGGGG